MQRAQEVRNFQIQVLIFLHFKTAYMTQTKANKELYRLLFATRSSSSFFLIAYELELPLAALMSSSARHSEMLFTLRKAASRAPIVSSAIAWLTRRRGDTSTAWRRTVPAEPILVESSRGPQLTMASTATCTGFWSVRTWIYDQLVSVVLHRTDVIAWIDDTSSYKTYNFKRVRHNPHSH